MDNANLTKKLIRRHRRELTELIGSFRISTQEGCVKLTTASGEAYTARTVAGEPPWLTVNDVRGCSVATLD